MRIPIITVAAVLFALVVFAIPAFAHASSFTCPPGAPLRPTPPIVSSPALIGIPPPSGMTSANMRWPALAVSVRFAHAEDA